ncbi:hypothetical protein AAL_00499 [Moelleriella libera RCEF 2490]|uniref:Nuclear pore assembly and biogenesis protein, APQ12 n=1 Tax=Moelleriella libera RCEF 2490 TaxID=1081109 RepID=A0A166UW57_9HYPO|nr:hypothetical protein AAL_00499 [Moelleriella libera RCEF 2490]
MDASLFSRLVAELLPPSLANSVRNHLLNPRGPLQFYKRQLSTQMRSLTASLQPHVQPVLDRILALAVENQGITGMVALVVLMTVVVVVMNWIRRLIMWWTRIVARAMFWAGVVVLLAWIWERGVMESVRDGVVVGGKVVGYLAVLKDFWMAEYQRYEADGSAGRPSSSGRGRVR